MQNNLKFTMTNDSITVFVSGKTHMVKKGAPNFAVLKKALLTEDWESAAKNLTPAKSLHDYLKGSFKLVGGIIMYEENPIAPELQHRIEEMLTGNEDPGSILNFWARLQKNPSKRSVDQLWAFLSHQGIPLTKDGTFLAYKSVRDDYKDHHSGVFDNSPGVIHQMPRNKISDDPKEACHEGFHVGALKYAQNFGNQNSRIVVCEVDPADVVCIPYDSSHQKMRVARYRVVGHHGGELLPSTSLDENLSVTSKPSKKGFKKLESMNVSELMEQTVEDLRQYANKGLGIVGVSKLPGGKVALVRAITNVRRQKKEG